MRIVMSVECLMTAMLFAKVRVSEEIGCDLAGQYFCEWLVLANTTITNCNLEVFADCNF